MQFYFIKNLSKAGKSKMMLFTSLANCSERRLEQVESALFDKFQPLFSLRCLGIQESYLELG